MMVLDDLPPLLTPAELADLMRTTTNSLSQDRYLGRGVPFIKNGKRVLYARTAVLDYLERNTAQRTDDPRGVSA
ncbi:helix-turn-helix domain-containing protein [Mycolicibacterium sp. CR10]|uniref:helix-turn-helix domain-containing protein n=1 Tax=Mycolicibacterium sp. CR10 TaxID=2562314 RepID=UPI001F0DA324|nr:helix-turn-helix domain-containing protein [Mycolicibacterium sp. CR10]